MSSRPRIRSLKPEIWTSRDFRALAPCGRLTFICLITNADDEGRLKTDAGHLADVYLPGMPSDLIATQLEQMERLEMITVYKVHGKTYVALRNWPRHQKVDHPTPSELPSPPKFKRGIGVNKAQIELDFLASQRDTSRQIGSDRTGSDRSVSDRNGHISTIVELGEFMTRDDAFGVQQANARARQDQVGRIFHAWRESTGKKRAVCDPKRRRLIEAALKLYSEEDVVDAVRGWQHSPHHRGENDRGTVYNDLELLLRDVKHIEQFRDWERGIGRPVPKLAGQGTTATAISQSRRFTQIAEELRAKGE